MSDAVVSDSTQSTPAPRKPAAAQSGKPPLVVIPIVLVALYWAAFAVTYAFEMTSFTRFLWQLLALVGLALPYSIWWLAHRDLRFWQRLGVFAFMIVTGVGATLLLQKDVLPPVPILMTLPWLFTVGTLWLLVARAFSPRVRLVGLLVLPVIGWTPMTLVRMEGMSGGGASAFRWRWSPSPEELYLAELGKQQKNSSSPKPPATRIGPLVAGEGDWPRFRGAHFDSAVRGLKIATNWNESPPKQVWRRRIGPGWASMTIVDGVLFTQDQRDSAEVVAAYDAGTGDELWTHEDVDPQRFEESMGGPGPRATPTFADGKIYTLGAKGIFNCLDAVTGKPHWQRDIAKDAGAAVPMWAFSSSPLVEGDLVYVFAGSEKGKNLLAYHADSGEPAWTAIAGKHSYSSPQLAVLGGQRQILFVGEDTVSAFEPTSGEMLWQHKGPPNPQYASIQPNVVGDSQVLVSLCPDVGTTLLEVTRTGGASAENSDADAWQVEEKWNTRDIKPFFNDFVLHDGFLYGFDNEIFCCVDLATGKRRWKGGRYSTGQVLLLADQSLLLVMAEAGEAVLVAAEPQAHRELGRFTPLTAKTWNHPVIVGSRLYVRNSEEMACFELTPAS